MRAPSPTKAWMTSGGEHSAAASATPGASTSPRQPMEQMASVTSSPSAAPVLMGPDSRLRDTSSTRSVGLDDEQSGES